MYFLQDKTPHGPLPVLDIAGWVCFGFGSSFSMRPQAEQARLPSPKHHSETLSQGVAASHMALGFLQTPSKPCHCPEGMHWHCLAKPVFPLSLSEPTAAQMSEQRT